LHCYSRIRQSNACLLKVEMEVAPDELLEIEEEEEEEGIAAREDEIMAVEDNPQEEEMSDEDEVLSDDSCYDSDIEEDVVEEVHRVLNQAEVNTLDSLKKMCGIYFYYAGDSAKFCSSCIVRISGLFSRLCAVRKHDINPYILIDGLFCSECRYPLYQIMPCNLCPICTQ